MATFESSGTNGAEGIDGAAGAAIADMPKAANGQTGQPAECSTWGDEGPTNAVWGAADRVHGNSGQSGTRGAGGELL
jgi:hypothetical protein